MKSSLFSLGRALACLVLVSIASSFAAETAAPKKKVLFFSKSSGFEHDAIKTYGEPKFGYAFPVLKALGAETWYDGIDADCRGDDDYDQDVDGVAIAGRGEDCDDEAPDVYPGARETLGDGVESDCIGGDDAAKLEANSTTTLNDVRAMRFVESDTRVYLALGAAQIVTPTVTYYDSAVAFSWFRADLSDGYDSFVAWLPLTSDPAAFHLTTASFAVDTISGEDVLYGFFGLELTSGSGSRSLRAYRYNVDRASVFGGPTLSVAGPRQPFDSVGMVLGADGRMHGVGCEATDGVVSWVRWTPGAATAGNRRRRASTGVSGR
jgi:hypothetical protein